VFRNSEQDISVEWVQTIFSEIKQCLYNLLRGFSGLPEKRTIGGCSPVVKILSCFSKWIYIDVNQPLV
jgi:hypothetical protein